MVTDAEVGSEKKVAVGKSGICKVVAPVGQ
jgi:hypothetical protein